MGQKRDVTRHVGRSVRVSVDRTGFSVGFLPVVGGPNVPRGTVTKFSAESAKRLERYLRNCIARYEFFGTLTVADDLLDGEAFKRALDLFLRRFHRSQVREVQTKGDRELSSTSSTCWFLEFQKRGAPHVHLLYTDYVPWRKAASDWVDAIDQPWCFETSTKFEKLRGPVASYATKYAGKLDQKKLPEGVESFGRWWGVRGDRSTVSATYDVKISRDNVFMVAGQLNALDSAAKVAVEQGSLVEYPFKHGGGVRYYWSKHKSGQQKAHKGAIHAKVAIFRTIPGAEAVD
jgi:hypothetical protein